MLTTILSALSAFVLASPGCTFKPNVDYSDAAGPVTDAKSKEECCAACTALPSCVVAVFQTSGMKCFTKLGGKLPHANSGVVACVTNRTKPTPQPSKKDPYQCLFRELALEYAEEVVLRGWESSRASAARVVVSTGLRIHECTNGTTGRHRDGGTTGRDAAAAAARAQHTLYVAPMGNNSAAGTAYAPLKTIQGAQARIRALYPPGSTRTPRPALTVLLKGGDYFLPPRRATSQQHSPLVFATFTEADSGTSATKPIVFASDPTSQTRATLHGGILLDDFNLKWSSPPASLHLPPSTIMATLPSSILIDSQDQLYLQDQPLVRARTPNGRPWLPLDGFNLTTAVDAECGVMPDVPRVYDVCTPPPAPAPPAPFPGTNPPPPPAPPAVGSCSAIAANVSLLYAFPKPDIVLGSAHAPTAAACAELCNAELCCAGFTWHDLSAGSYAFRCYFIANPIKTWSRALPQIGHFSGLCNHGAKSNVPCAGTFPPHQCTKVNIACSNGGVHQVDGFVGDSFADVPLGDDINVSACYSHLPDMGNSWPHWTAVGFDRIDEDNATHTWANMFDLSQNAPKWYGPWSGGILVKASQDVGNSVKTPLDQLTWADAAGTVVHAMADGEWGGVQFEVGSAEKVVNATTKKMNGDARLHFTRGGWQQARPATMKTSNRFYMEGNLEFLDVAGEWHYDAKSRALFMIPPRGNAAMTSLVLTQSDCLLRFEGSSMEGRTAHLRFENMTFTHTSASFFHQHEESSGGDYAVTRSAAIVAENASSITISGCDFMHIGGNAVVLSNSVNNVSITRNHMSFLGTSGVLLIGRTGRALMDARDGEAMVAAAFAAGAVDPAAADNGVRLPRDNSVTFNIIHDYGIWDKQSAAFHKALAPGNEFSWNIVFNASRHGVNFQDSMGGGGVVDGNVFFSLNRETHDTAALNSWGRRNYLFSGSNAEDEPSTPQLIPSTLNSWRNNLILARPLGLGPTDAGDFYSHANCLRCDDGASWYNMTANVCVGASSAMEFNGGTQVFTQDNLFVQGGWTLCASPPTKVSVLFSL